MSEAEGSVQLRAQCLCKAHTFTTEVSRSSLPLKATCCHCTSCRHNTGALYTSDAEWPGDGDEIAKASLQKYIFTKSVTVLFCGTCSSPMFYLQKPQDPEEPVTYGVFTGVLANDSGDIVRFTDHMFLGDTIDGGASPWLRNVNEGGRPARLWEGRIEKSEELSHDWPPVSSLTNSILAEVDEIPIRCRCKGVNLVLRRPDKDLETGQAADLAGFVDPVTNKNAAAFDACDSCRLSSGMDLFYWAFAKLRHIAFPSHLRGGRGEFPESTLELKASVSASHDRDPRFGTLTYYSSSSDVQRYFCSVCSACVFYAVDDRPDIIDVAVGLLESQDGARAETFLCWALGGEVGWREDVMGGWRESLVKGVETEAENWRIQRGYPKNWRRAEADEAKKRGDKQ